MMNRINCELRHAKALSLFMQCMNYCKNISFMSMIVFLDWFLLSWCIGYSSCSCYRFESTDYLFLPQRHQFCRYSGNSARFMSQDLNSFKDTHSKDWYYRLSVMDWIAHMNTHSRNRLRFSVSIPCSKVSNGIIHICLLLCSTPVCISSKDSLSYEIRINE